MAFKRGADIMTPVHVFGPVRKRCATTLLTGAVIGAGLVGSVLSGSRSGAATFSDLCYPKSYPKSVGSFLDKTWTAWDNLKYRTDPNDASGQSDVLVSKEGYKGSDGWVGEVWRMGFLRRLYNDVGEFTGWGFVGYANNDNSNSNSFNSSSYPYPYHLDGWLAGGYFNNYEMMPAGTRPDDVFLVNDKNGDGVGEVSGGNWTLGDDDVLYYKSDILFASGPQMDDFVRGDTSRLPEYPYDNTLPNMVVSPRGPGDAIYQNGERFDREGLKDLIVLSEHWLTEGHGAHDYWANGADHNLDGEVDMRDFSVMARHWTNGAEYWADENFEYMQTPWETVNVGE